MKLEPIQKQDIDAAFDIVKTGVQRLKDQGIDQWQKGYPDREAIEIDYNSNTGYLLKDDQNNAVAYASITTDKEDLYESFKSWTCASHYAIVHRVSISDEYVGKGYAKLLFDEIQKKCEILNVKCIRIDTHPENTVMIKVMERNDYTIAGKMMYPEGVRIAFEKCI